MRSCKKLIIGNPPRNIIELPCIELIRGGNNHEIQIGTNTPSFIHFSYFIEQM